jgi:hypothetical protein
VAQKVNIVLVDDMDNTEEGVQTVEFSLDGTAYQIDLSEAHADELRKALAPYVAASRRVSNKAKSGKPSSATVSSTDIREWAKANGFAVSERGRIPKEIREAYANRLHVAV